MLFWMLLVWTAKVTSIAAFVSPNSIISKGRQITSPIRSSIDTTITQEQDDSQPLVDTNKENHVVIIGSGWGGLSAAHHLSKSGRNNNDDEEDKQNSMRRISSITVVDAAPRVGGLVRDGYNSIQNNNGTTFKAEAGQHGFWDNYHNIFKLLYDDLGLHVDQDILTGYDVQGQYSPRGLEAIWPVYRNHPQLPTGLAQAVYTKFQRLSVADRLTALPLVLAFSEFDNSEEMWNKYDGISFRDLCIQLGVSRRCYEEAFEPMILTGIVCDRGKSAVLQLPWVWRYFFVLKSQNSFDVRWCKGNIGEKIMDPWVKFMMQSTTSNGDPHSSGDDDDDDDDNTHLGVKFLMSTRVVGFRGDGNKGNKISKVICCDNTTSQPTAGAAQSSFELDADTVIFAVGGAALNALVRNSPLLAKHDEFRRFANLRGTGVLATRLYLDRFVEIPYSANACWGFDKGIGQTFFDISKLHAIQGSEGSIVEVDYYHAASLIVMDNESIVKKVKRDLDIMLGYTCQRAQVVDAAIVRLPNAVNWYSPGSYANMPNIQSKSISNVYFVGDIVKTKHGSWSQEKAYVTGAEAANVILGRPIDTNIISLSPDEVHVAAGKQLVTMFKSVVGLGDQSLVDFLW
jgi:Uncharacterized conserved protein